MTWAVFVVASIFAMPERRLGQLGWPGPQVARARQLGEAWQAEKR